MIRKHRTKTKLACLANNRPFLQGAYKQLIALRFTVADAMGVAAGAYAQQYELEEFQSLASCTMSFSANPAMDSLNGKIRGNPALPADLSERIPAEPLVVAPYASIGKYGGTF